MTEEFICGFAPVIDENSKILILGSFPSVKSREVGFYYGNPRNRFWKTVCGFFGEEVPDCIDGKTEFLLKRNIALWDSIESCSIRGSSDSDINLKTAKPVSIGELLTRAPKLRAVICNGKKSYEMFSYFNKDVSIPVICLPSTSPANVSFNEKKWQDALKEFLTE